MKGRPSTDSTRAGLAVVGRGGSLDLAESLYSFYDLPTASVPDSLDGCIIHFFLFPGNLKLEVLSSEAVGLQAVYVMYDYFSQTIFILKRFHLAGPQFRHHM